MEPAQTGSLAPDSCAAAAFREAPVWARFKGRSSSNGLTFFPGNAACDAIPPDALRRARDDIDHDDRAGAALAVVLPDYCVFKLSTGDLAAVVSGETGDAAYVLAVPPMPAAAAPGACPTAQVTLC